MPWYFNVLINNCHLQRTNIIPDGGNCGLWAFSLVLWRNNKLISKLDDLRTKVNLSPLFEFPSTKIRQKHQHQNVIKDTLANYDWMSYLQDQYSESLDENSAVIESILHTDSTLLTFRDIYTFDAKHAAHPAINNPNEAVKNMCESLKKRYKKRWRRQYICRALKILL